mmetsp:Transcript_7215/g.19733  ORF Transcript_7215/g.19733 Transcript_7215/m.19733 type:complete len:245 (-) Transcript_7215:612-1346(-)
MASLRSTITFCLRRISVSMTHLTTSIRSTIAKIASSNCCDVGSSTTVSVLTWHSIMDRALSLLCDASSSWSKASFITLRDQARVVFWSLGRGSFDRSLSAQRGCRTSSSSTRSPASSATTIPISCPGRTRLRILVSFMARRRNSLQASSKSSLSSCDTCGILSSVSFCFWSAASFALICSKHTFCRALDVVLVASSPLFFVASCGLQAGGYGHRGQRSSLPHWNTPSDAPSSSILSASFWEIPS